MSREAHVRFWEGVGVRLPCATRLGTPGVSNLTVQVETDIKTLIQYLP